jgi:flagellar hook assembly protein FlgD
VTLKIYNLLGAEVATLVDNEQKPAGYHVVVWDARDGAGRNVTSGVYFIRMRAGNFVQTSKTLLIE